MNCAEFRETLFEQPSLQTRLAQGLHTTGCAGCRAEAQQTKQIGKAVRALPRHPAPDGLRERLTRVAAEEGSAPRRRRLAWSQVLVAAATLLILSAILYPIASLVRQKQAASEAEDALALDVCLKNLKDLGLACHMYAQEHDQHLPAMENWPSAIAPYLEQSGDSPVLWCPEDTDATHWPSYAMSPSSSGADLSSLKDLGKHALLYDAEADGSFARRHVAPTGAVGGNAAYLDGHSMFSRDAPLGVPGHVPEP